MNVKNTFLNGELIEELYMKPPSGYSHSLSQVYKLRRALHGLKQAPRMWFAKFNYTIGKLDIDSSTSDHGFFIRKPNSGIVLVLFYVDDMIITGTDVANISDLK